jgi:hypothetical protein
MLLQAAQWIAPAATMIAAMMTAANLGARVTGWGFVVFTVGAIGWVIVALASGQHNLLLSNGFLLIVDLVGIWRWLGRRARYDEGAAQAASDSDRAPTPSLFALSKIEGRPVIGPDGATLAATVDAMAGCDDGRVRYLVVSRGGVGGVGESLHALGWEEVTIGEEAISARIGADALDRRPALDPTDWPESARAAGVDG